MMSVHKTPVKQKSRNGIYAISTEKKRTREGSNLRPIDPQSIALSTELRVQTYVKVFASPFTVETYYQNTRDLSRDL